MVDETEVLARWQDEAISNCAPLYIQDFFLAGGHDESTRNATATFISFEGRYFACTCRHAVELVEKRRKGRFSRFPTLALGLKRGFINLSFFTAEGLRDAVSIVEPGEGEHYMDLAIADISDDWEVLSTELGKQTINLNSDHWREPRWARVEMLAAAGWPEEGKRNVTRNGEDRVSGTMTLISAERSGSLARDERIVLMKGTLEEPHGWHFSGVSGGPMYAQQNEILVPVGITFEGWPQTRGDTHPELTDKDIMVRGLTLTPDNFNRWLVAAKLKAA